MSGAFPAWRPAVARFLTVFLLGAPLAGICGHCFASAMDRAGTGNCHDADGVAPMSNSHGSAPGDQCACEAWTASDPEILQDPAGPVSSAPGWLAAIPVHIHDTLAASGTDPCASFPDSANRSVVSPVELYCTRLE